jgi:hypothetical protein
MARESKYGTPLRVQIPVELANRIRALAKADDRSASYVIEKLLEKALADKEKI